MYLNVLSIVVNSVVNYVDTQKVETQLLSVNMAYKPLIHIGSLTDKLKLVVLPSPVV